MFIQQHCNVILVHRDQEDASFNLEAPATYTNKMMTVFHQDPGTLQNGCHQSSNYTSSPYVIRYTLAYLATVQLALRLLRTIFMMQFDSSFYQGIFKDYTLLDARVPIMLSPLFPLHYISTYFTLRSVQDCQLPRLHQPSSIPYITYCLLHLSFKPCKLEFLTPVQA